MHRIDGPGATVDNKFTEGDPSGGVAATEVTADWLNDVQENIAGAVESAGRVLSKGDYGQLWRAMQLSQWNPRPRPMEMIAHRGFATLAPENTMTAFSNAHRLGARSLEFDIQITSDGVPVVFHDATVDALTDGTGPVSGYTLAALQALDAGSHFSSAFSSCKIPTLEEVLEFCKGRFETIYPELKANPSEANIDTIVSMIESAGLIGNTFIQSFYIEEVEYVRSINDDVGVMLAAGVSIGNLPRLAALGPPCMMFMYYPTVEENPTWPATIRAAGADLMVYTVNDNEAIQRLLAMGVTKICSDRAYFGEATGGIR